MPKVIEGNETLVNDCFRSVVCRTLEDYPNNGLLSIEVFPVLEFDYLGVKTSWGAPVVLEPDHFNDPIWDVLVREAKKVKGTAWKLEIPPTVIDIRLNLENPKEVWLDP